MVGLLDRHLIYVTGKGGVGKTTVAASLGLAAAARGKRTIVCEVGEQHHMATVLANVDAEHEEEIADGLFAISIDPQRALEEYLGRQVGGAALKVLLRSQAFQYFVAAAPGAKEMITMAKIWEIAQGHRWTTSNRVYDTVVVDAPASGHGLAMLSTPGTFGDIARVGTVQRQAYKVRDMLRDPRRIGYVAVALPEEMPVTETIELQGKLVQATGLELDAIVVNGLYPERFTGEEVDRLRALAASDGRAPQLTGAVQAALAVDERARAQRQHLRRLRKDATAPVHTLPYLFERELGLDEYRELGRRLVRRMT